MAGETKFSQITAAGAIVGTDSVLGVQPGPTDVLYTVTNLASAIFGIGGASLALGGATIGTNALAVTGTVLFNGAETNAAAGAASAPALMLTGVIFTGGTGTTTFPHLLIQPSTATASTTWSTSGTAFGINAHTGIGRLVDLQLDGTTVFNISTAGTAFAVGGLTVGAATAITWNGRGIMTSTGTGSVRFGNLDSATPVAQTLQIQSVVAGTAAANGVNFTLSGSLPTGTGVSGDIIIQTGVKTGSGTTQGTPTTALTIKGETQLVQVGAGGLRIDQTPTQISQATTMTFSSGADSASNIGHRISINMNGTTYWIPASTTAF